MKYSVLKPFTFNGIEYSPGGGIDSDLVRGRKLNQFQTLRMVSMAPLANVTSERSTGIPVDPSCLRTLT
jgi:hypothetical protein